MIALACLVVCAILGLVAMQSVLTWSFVRTLRNFAVPLISDEKAPRAVVMLCLRGTDPFLRKCLFGLLNQDYPAYQVRIVIDRLRIRPTLLLPKS